MRALLCKVHGPPESLEVAELPDPKPGPGQVVIQVAAAAVNFPDTLIIRDLYQFKPPLPFAPGGECAGTVCALGPGVSGLRVGDPVAAMPLYGAFAERVVCDAACVVPLPAGLDLGLAAATLMAHGTALYALAERGRLAAGETLLVLGAAGGVGLAAVELGRLLGARVIAAASSAEKLAACAEQGADARLDYRREPFRERLKELTGGRGVDLVFDPVGGPLSEPAFRSLAWGGRHLVVGFAAGEIPRLPLNLPLLKGASLVGVFYGELQRREPARWREQAERLFAWLAEGRIRPRIAARFPLAEGGRAIRALMERQVIGKVLVEPGR